MRAAAALLTAVFLVAWALPALAEPETAALPPETAAPPAEDPVPPTEPVPAAETLSDWAELRAWLEAPTGSAVLTQSITVSADTSFVCPPIRFGTGAVLDCAAFSIYVEGELRMEQSPGLTIQGHGGTEGLFHVRPGGALFLALLTLTASPDALALVQEPGSLVRMTSGDFLSGGVAVTGGLVFSEEPVLTAPVDGVRYEEPYFLVPEEEGYEDQLPQTRRASLILNGAPVPLGDPDGPDGAHNFQQSVTWDLSPQQQTSLENRLRTTLEGHFTGPLAAPGFQSDTPYHLWFSPQVLMVFPVDGAALLTCHVKPEIEQLNLSFTFSPTPQVYRLLRSTDEGETWQTVGGDHTPLSGVSQWTLTHWLDTPEDHSAWYLVEAEYRDEEDTVRLVHTDTIQPSGAQILAVDWIDGNRGGGEGITGITPEPPNLVLPPTTSEPTLPPTPAPPSGDTDAPEEDPTPEETKRPTPTPVVTKPPETPPPAPETTPPPEPTPLPTPAPPQTDPPASPPPTDTPPPGAEVPAPIQELPVETDSGARPAETPLPIPAAAVNPTPIPEPVPTALPAPASPADPPAAVTPAIPPSPAPAPTPEAEPEASSAALSPAAQIAIGCASVAALGAAATAVLNPGLIRSLGAWLRRR